ncbi:MAG: HAMP domain-containing sensor histidine kinase [Pseudomonadota bacterium]
MEPQDDLDFSDFIASAIHDMKNSLSIQTGFLEELMVKFQHSADPQTLSRLGHAIYEAGRMNVNLIQVLSLYKLGKSIYPIDISEHAVDELLQDVVLQNQFIMEQKGIRISIDCAPGCFWYFDRDLVSGVLINALNNAYNYTQDQIRLAARIHDGALEIRVEDNGRGYPPAMLQERITKSKSINFRTGSTGLGFYFSSRVAEMHRNGDRLGALTIENGGAFGGGCFVLTLP